jgi:hypothetical protein
MPVMRINPEEDDELAAAYWLDDCVIGVLSVSVSPVAPYNAS